MAKRKRKVQVRPAYRPNPNVLAEYFDRAKGLAVDEKLQTALYQLFIGKMVPRTVHISDERATALWQSEVCKQGVEQYNSIYLIKGKIKQLMLFFSGAKYFLLENTPWQRRVSAMYKSKEDIQRAMDYNQIIWEVVEAR